MFFAIYLFLHLLFSFSHLNAYFLFNMCYTDRFLGFSLRIQYESHQRHSFIGTSGWCGREQGCDYKCCSHTDLRYYDLQERGINISHVIVYRFMDLYFRLLAYDFTVDFLLFSHFFIYLFIYLIIYLFIHSFIYSFIHLFIYSFF